MVFETSIDGLIRSGLELDVNNCTSIIAVPNDEFIKKWFEPEGSNRKIIVIHPTKGSLSWAYHGIDINNPLGKSSKKNNFYLLFTKWQNEEQIYRINQNAGWTEWLKSQPGAEIIESSEYLLMREEYARK